MVSLFFIIISIVLMFVFSLFGAWTARMFNPGTYLIYAQTFASGAFLGISILHFIPETVKDFYEYDPDIKYPYYSAIILIVFCIFCILEMRAISQIEHAQPDFRDISDDSVKDFSVFLMHRFTAIPSSWMRITVYVCLCLHSIIIAFAIACDTATQIHISLLLATIVEKFVESFTISIIARKGTFSLSTFWILIVLYSLITPAFIALFYFLHIHNNILISAIASALSSGLFLFIGILLWRKTFLTPFDWQRTELIIVSTVFIVSIAIQAVTCIDFSINTNKITDL